MRLGSTETQKAEVRILAATNVDLKQMVTAGRFREDLLLPALRDPDRPAGSCANARRPASSRSSFRFYAAENGKNVRSIEPEAMKALFQHQWPGNVRELENAIERSVVLCSGSG